MGSYDILCTASPFYAIPSEACLVRSKTDSYPELCLHDLGFALLVNFGLLIDDYLSWPCPAATVLLQPKALSGLL